MGIGRQSQMKRNWRHKAKLMADGNEDGYTNLEEYLNGTDPTVFVD